MKKFNSAKRGLPYAVIFLTVCALYGKSLGFDFIPSWDDGQYVIDNPFIRNITLGNIKKVFTTTFSDLYGPVHILSYFVDYALWGSDPFGYHLSNLVLHGLNACIVYALIRKTVNKSVAFFSALFFAVHPLNVEDVAWIAERKTLLATFFFLLAFICYMIYREKGSFRLYILSMLLFVLAIFSKAVEVILPLVLFSYEVFLRQTHRKWLPLMPYLFISFIGAGIAVWAQSHGAFEKSAFSLQTVLGTVYPTMITVYWKYIGLILFPHHLSGFYDTTLYHSFLSFPVLAGLTAWLSVFIAVFVKCGPQLRFWFLWFWICSLPVSNIIPIYVYYADRYMYTPAIGLVIIAGMALLKLSDYLKTRDSKLRSVLHAAVCLILVSYGIVSYNRLDVWRNERVFWEDTVKKSPTLYVPHFHLGFVYEKEGLLDKAEREYREAAAIYPTEQVLLQLRIVGEEAASQH